MKPWHWVGLAVIGVAALAVLAYTTGVGVERNRGITARLALITANNDSARAHAAQIARLEQLAVSRETLRREAQARAEAAERRAQSASQGVVAARDSLKASRTAADSLKAYPPLVASLARQVFTLDTTAKGYKAAAAASDLKVITLEARIAADSAEIARQRRLIGTVTPSTPKPSGWGCVAGVTIAGGIRSGAGIGITCGRRLG